DILRQDDAGIMVPDLFDDGTSFTAVTVRASVAGPAAGSLSAERVALNFTQRLSGIATLTSLFVNEVATVAAQARIADTRKSTPALRALDKHAVVGGGGGSHRRRLPDA